MKISKGFTLVELMIAIVIGIFLVTGMMNLFITMNRSVTLSDAMSQNQETGRFAMDYLTQYVRQAGYSDGSAAQRNSQLDPVFMSGGACPIDGACTENNPTETSSDGSIQPSIRGDRIAIQLSVADGETIRACSGTQITGPRRFANVFWVSADSDSDRELRCRPVDTQTNTWIDTAPVSIVGNIELMEMQLGIAADSNDRQAARYINLDTFDPGTNRVSWIRSIRVAILTTSTSSDESNQTNIDNRQYVVLDSPVLAFNDGSLRSIFTNTVELPNAIESAYMN